MIEVFTSDNENTRNGDPSGEEEEVEEVVVEEEEATTKGITTTRNGRNITLQAAKSKKLRFPFQLFKLLQDAKDKGFDDVIAWIPGGSVFKVFDLPWFETYILPGYFNMSKYKSFQRQLNLYGFRKVYKGPGKGGYFHELFHHDRPGDCQHIKRQKKGEKKEQPNDNSGNDHNTLSSESTTLITPRHFSHSQAAPIHSETGKKTTAQRSTVHKPLPPSLPGYLPNGINHRTPSHHGTGGLYYSYSLGNAAASVSNNKNPSGTSQMQQHRGLSSEGQSLRSSLPDHPKQSPLPVQNQQDSLSLSLSSEGLPSWLRHHEHLLLEYARDCLHLPLTSRGQVFPRRVIGEEVIATFVPKKLQQQKKKKRKKKTTKVDSS